MLLLIKKLNNNGIIAETMTLSKKYLIHCRIHYFTFESQYSIAILLDSSIVLLLVYTYFKIFNNKVSQKLTEWFHIFSEKIKIGLNNRGEWLSMLHIICSINMSRIIANRSCISFMRQIWKCQYILLDMEPIWRRVILGSCSLSWLSAVQYASYLWIMTMIGTCVFIEIWFRCLLFAQFTIQLLG